MKWVLVILQSLQGLGDLRQYGKPFGIAFGILLMLSAIGLGSMALMIFGAAFTAFVAWPR